MTQRGIDAARAGHKAQARQLLIAATKSDEDDIVAWWWLAQVIDEPKGRHKCLEKARAVAAQSEQGRRLYAELLRESGAPALPRYKLGVKSKSLGDQCPTCSVKMVTREEVVICPACNRANHRECWEDNIFHCGHYACAGSALVNSEGAVKIEAAGKAQTIQVDDSEIPSETPWASRETKEAGFVNRLRQQAIEAMAARMEQEMLFAGLQEFVVRQRVEALRLALARRTKRALLAGLLVGIILAVPTFRYSQSWIMAMFTLYLTAWGMWAAAGYSFLAQNRFISVLYWLLPQLLAALLMWITFGRWGIGIAASALGFICAVILLRILKLRPIYERRTFVTCSVWLLLVIGIFYYR